MYRLTASLASVVFVLSFGVVSMWHQPALAQTGEEQPQAQEVTPDKWPRQAVIGGATYTIYQPQLDSWDGRHIEVHAAVSVLPAGAKEPDFGALSVTAKTHVFRVLRTVHFRDIQITRATFPSVPDKAAAYQQGFQQMVTGGGSTMSLARLEAMRAVEKNVMESRQVPVKNAPPAFVFSQQASVLINIDGNPVWGPVNGTTLERVINTRVLMLLDDSTGKYYIHLFDGFVEAAGLSGPWTPAAVIPAGANDLAQALGKERVVDLMTGPPDPDNQNKTPSLKNVVPMVVVATSPTELIVTQGTPDWALIEGTQLLYVKNTTGNVFKSLTDQNTYVLVTGRWFRGQGFTGPWQYVPGASLPPDFAKIPDDSPKENVKASVPGTPQAQAAVIADQIPHTATVNRATASFTPRINGEPEMKAVPDTPLMYVYNSPTPIIMVSESQWFAVQNGVWFTAPSVLGPWTVASSVPAVIYSIPPSSPIYYVTYVKIYDVTDQYVVEGYTPGYMGTVVTTDGVVVYGTGYTYITYVSPSAWYPAPVTYGYAANETWTPWTGWAVGFGLGWAMGAMSSMSSCCWGYAAAPYWGAMPYAPYSGYAYGAHGGAAAWGYGGWAATTGNVYHSWGATTAETRTSAGYNAWTGNAWANKVGTSYNSVTGRASAGQQAAVGNVYTGNYAYGQRGATYNPNTGVAVKGGSATVGNAYTGSQTSAQWAQATGPHGQTAGVAQVNNNYYADHDGNVYKDTGSGWEKYDNGSWNSVSDNKQAQSLQSQQQARAQGDQRSASSSWGSGSWGDSFSGDRSSGGGGGGESGWAGGGDRSGGGGGGDSGYSAGRSPVTGVV